MQPLLHPLADMLQPAGQQLTMAQKISRGVTKVAKQREQEDAQEFLTSLLNRTHDELLKLRAMYGTQGLHFSDKRTVTKLPLSSVLDLRKPDLVHASIGMKSCSRLGLIATRGLGCPHLAGEASTRDSVVALVSAHSHAPSSPSHSTPTSASRTVLARGVSHL